MNEEMKKLLGDLNSTWELMKKELDAARANGGETAEQKEKLAKMEKAMSAIEAKMQDLEAKANRPNPQTEAKDKEVASVKLAEVQKSAFFKSLAGRRLNDEERKAVSEMNIPEDMKTMTLADEGSLGFLAPPEFMADVLKNVVQFSPFRNVVTVRTIAGRELQRPRRASTLSASWIGEDGLPSETTKTHDLIKIPAHKLGALAKVTADSLEDISFLEADLREEFGEQFGVSEGVAFLSGNGVEKPHGILTNTSVNVRTSAGSGVIDFDDLADTMGDLKEPYWPTSQWYFQRLTLVALRKIRDLNGQYIWEPSTAAGVPPTILGRPYMLMPDMDSIAAGNKPVIFGDLRRGYMIVDRRDMVVQVFREKYAPAIGYLATKRVGGQVMLPEAIKVLKVKA